MVSSTKFQGAKGRCVGRTPCAVRCTAPCTVRTTHELVMRAQWRCCVTYSATLRKTNSHWHSFRCETRFIRDLGISIAISDFGIPALGRDWLDSKYNRGNSDYRTELTHEFPLAAEFVPFQSNKKNFSNQLEIYGYIYYTSNTQISPLQIFKNWPKILYQTLKLLHFRARITRVRGDL